MYIGLGRHARTVWRPRLWVLLLVAGGVHQEDGVEGHQGEHRDQGPPGVREGAPRAPPPLSHACLHSGGGECTFPTRCSEGFSSSHGLAINVGKTSVTFLFCHKLGQSLTAYFIFNYIVRTQPYILMS